MCNIPFWQIILLAGFHRLYWNQLTSSLLRLITIENKGIRFTVSLPLWGGNSGGARFPPPRLRTTTKQFDFWRLIGSRTPWSPKLIIIGISLTGIFFPAYTAHWLQDKIRQECPRRLSVWIFQDHSRLSKSVFRIKKFVISTLQKIARRIFWFSK